MSTGSAGEVELTNMAVVTERRGTGIGRPLVCEAVARCAADGLTRMVVATAAADVGNLRFHRRVGFRTLSVGSDWRRGGVADGVDG